MHRPDRVVVGDALGVVPHPVAVDDVCAGRLGDADHPAVDVRGHAAEQLFGHPAHPLRPVLAHQVVVAADAATGDDHRLCAEIRSRRRCFVTTPRRAARRRLQHRAAHADRGAVLDDQLVDAMPVREPDLRVAEQPAREDRRRSRARSPGDVEPRHRVAVSARVVATTLGPARRAGRSAGRVRAASCASHPPRSRRKRAPTAAASGPPGGRSRRCPASPAAPARGCRGCPAAAVRGCRRRTARRTTSTPGHRCCWRSPGRRSARAGRVRPARRRRPDPPDRPRRR